MDLLLHKHRYPALLLLLLLSGCFGRGDLTPVTTSPVVNDVLLLNGRAHLAGRVTADDTVTFRNTTPALAVVSGARVEIEESGDSVSCDANGQFRFLNITPGVYHLRTYRRRNDGSQLLARQLVTILPGIQELSSSLQLQSPGGLQGQVKMTGIPASSLYIEINSPGGGRPLDADGSWRFDGLATGTYSVQLHREGYTSRALGTFIVPAGGVLQIPEIDPPLTPAGVTGLTLAVKTLNTVGQPLPGAQIWLSGNGRSGWTDSSGELRFSGLSSKPLVLHGTAYGFREATLAVNLISDQTLSVILQSGGYQGQPVVQISVLDNNQQPLTGARVRMIPETEPAITDSAGQSIVAADPGTIEIHVRKSGFLPGVSVLNLKGIYGTASVTLQPTPAITSYQISGIVQDNASRPQAGLVVYELQSGLATRTAANGSFTLQLPAGVRVLQVNGTFPWSARTSLDLQSNRTNIVLTLN